jgi:hypothetical protein
MTSRQTIIAGCVLLAAIIGVMLVEIVSNRPMRFIPDQSTGRACPALYLVRLSGHLFYYTTSAPCTASWSFALMGFAAALYLFGAPR